MGEALILETSFLIDLEREHRRGVPGPAFAFLELREDARLYLTFTIAGELAAGFSMSTRGVWEEFVRPFYLLPPSSDVWWEYGKAHRYLQANGRLIGTNDLWIAATAIAHGMPLVTANTEHFMRVPGLEVRAYREAEYPLVNAPDEPSPAAP
jgi:tRNA(fMet)-specific endonuclease VapC